MSHRNHRIIHTTADNQPALWLAECFYDEWQQFPIARTEEFEHVWVGKTVDDMLINIKNILEQQLQITDTAWNDISLLENDQNFTEFLDEREPKAERILSAQKNLRRKLAEVLKTQEDHERILRDEDFVEDEDVDWEQLTEEDEKYLST